MKISRIRGLLWQRVRVEPVVDCLAHREITSSLLAKLRKKSRSLSHPKFMLVPGLGGFSNYQRVGKFGAGQTELCVDKRPA